MSAPFDAPAQWIAALLISAAIFGTAMRLYAAWRLPVAHRPRAWRTLALVFLQLISLGLMWLLLRPDAPSSTQNTGIAILTPGATEEQVSSVRGVRTWRLPEVNNFATIERTPDLATLLRAQPAIDTVHVLGDGLPLRDLDALGVRRLHYTPSTLPQSLRAIIAPSIILAGRAFTITVEASSGSDTRVELRDPAGRRIALAPLTRDGRATLQAIARTPGPALFHVILREGERDIDRAAVPLLVREQEPAKLAVFSGGPSPEVKYLRRWAIDHGARLHSQIALGGGMQAGDAPIAMTPAALAGFDLAIFDERAWIGLGDGGRNAVLTAARNGLGVMIRMTAPMEGAAMGSLRRIGLEARAANLSTDTTLEPPTRGQPTLTLTRQALRLSANSGRVLLRDAGGQALGVWTQVGRGRVALWLPIDTYQFALAGSDQAFAQLWGNALGTLARARGEDGQETLPIGRIGERMTVCDTGENARIIDADGGSTPLLIDPVTGMQRCAAYWPRSAGWKQRVDDAGTHWLYVREANDALLLQRHAIQQANLRRADPGDTRARVHPFQRSRDITRWPATWLFLSWLLVSAGLWWLERSRIGRR